MTRIRCFIMVLICSLAMSMSAQNKSSWPDMQTSFLINVGISDYPKPSLGLSFARSGLLGYYANFMIGIDNMHLTHDYMAAEDGSLIDSDTPGLIPFYSGKRAVNRLSATMGGMCRMVIPLYAYVGAGYGYRTETRELVNKKWVEMANSPGHSGIVEVGLIGRIESLTLQAGYVLFIGREFHLYHEARVGLGITFNKK